MQSLTGLFDEQEGSLLRMLVFKLLVLFVHIFIQIITVIFILIDDFIEDILLYLLQALSLSTRLGQQAGLRGIEFEQAIFRSAFKGLPASLLQFLLQYFLLHIKLEFHLRIKFNSLILPRQQKIFYLLTCRFHAGLFFHLFQMDYSLLIPILLINEFGLFWAQQRRLVILLLTLLEEGKFQSFLSIFCFLLFEDFLHAYLEILELVASNGFVVFKTCRVQLQQPAEVIFDGLTGQLHLNLPLKQQVCVVDWQLKFLIGVSHESKNQNYQTWQIIDNVLLITLFYSQTRQQWQAIIFSSESRIKIIQQI